MRALTADVLRKETIENHQTVIKDVRENQATAKGDGSDTDNIQDSDYDEKHQVDNVLIDLDMVEHDAQI